MRKRLKNLSKIGATAVAGLMMGALAVPVMAAPGPGNIDPDEKGSITLHKYSGEPAGDTSDPDNPKPLPNDGSVVTGITNMPLDGVEFTLYPIEGLSVTDPADWTKIEDLNDWFNAQSTAGTWALDSSVGDDPSYTLGTGDEKTTNAQGEIDWTNLDLGVYAIEETGAPGTVAEHTLPFLVMVPTPHNSDNTWIYDVNVYPKNQVVDIDKEAVDPGSVGVGADVTWNVPSTVPKLQRPFDSYVMHDVLDARVKYVVSSSKVTLDDVELDAGDFEVVEAPANTLTMSLTPSGLGKLPEAAGEKLVWTFKTTVLKIGNGTIENEASILVNSPDVDWEEAPTSSRVSSNWGAINIHKFENTSAEKDLSGAKFQVFATQADANACSAAVTAAKGTLQTGCANAVEATRDVNGNELTPGQTIWETGVDGKALIQGLAVGVTNSPAQPGDSTERDYWVVEIVPPAGFINPAVVNKLTVTAGATTNGVLLDVPNEQEPPTTLPSTGGAGTLALILVAVALATTAVGVGVHSRRKEADALNN